MEVIEIVGENADDARYLLDAAVEKGTDAVVVTGGDGVISNALQVLAGTDVPLGIIPAGTGNDHAREFGIPTKDPEAAADIVVDGWTETIDLGRIRDHSGGEQVVRHRGGNRIRFAGDRSGQPNDLAARAVAVLHRDDGRTFAAAAAAVPVGARRKAGDRNRSHDDRVRKYPQLRRRDADLSQRRPVRRPARSHHGEVGIPDQADPLLPHRDQRAPTSNSTR